MSTSATATSGGVDVPVELDFERKTWTSPVHPPEGAFPFVVRIAGKRYELYSDGTLAEVEPDAN